MTFLELLRGSSRPAEMPVPVPPQLVALERQRTIAVESGSWMPYAQAITARMEAGSRATRALDNLRQKYGEFAPIQTAEVNKQPVPAAPVTYAEFAPVPPRPEVRPSSIGHTVLGVYNSAPTPMTKVNFDSISASNTAPELNMSMLNEAEITPESLRRFHDSIEEMTRLEAQFSAPAYQAPTTEVGVLTYEALATEPEA